MNVLVDRNIRRLFVRLLVCILVAVFLCAVFEWAWKNGSDGSRFYPLGCCLGLGIAILVVCYQYVQEQNKRIRHGVKQIQDAISGHKYCSIECSEEGELYRLFHEVNSLVSILNAHIEQEGAGKQFLKNTISDISHQLKTPLAALNIYNGIIQEESEDLSEIRRFADLSEQELDRIETLVQNLLKIARFDAGTMVMDKFEEPVKDMMEQIKDSFIFRTELEEKQILISGEEDLVVVCDRNWFIEAVGNLVKNALDHTQKGGVIQIAWKKSGIFVCISVKDNGCGIPREELYHIFKRFYRSWYSKEIPGLGLGLPLAKAIIEAHNGTVKVDSQTGVGTTFIIEL